MENDNLNTKIWGPNTWVTLHSISFCYPNNPTQEEKEKYKQFFELLGDLLPCKLCKDSYKEFINNGETKLDYSVLENRDKFTKWLYYVHDAVNNKLNINYDVSYDDVVKRYESYRAICKHNKNIKGCDAQKNKKIISYKIANNKECPVIPIKMARHFIKYAHMRNLPESEFEILNNIHNKNKVEFWNDRNDECSQIIKNMRLNDISSIENDGQWKGLPTIEELRLILRLSTNLSKENLTEIIKKLSILIPDCKCEYNKIYKLID